MALLYVRDLIDLCSICMHLYCTVVTFRRWLVSALRWAKLCSRCPLLKVALDSKSVWFIIH